MGAVALEGAGEFAPAEHVFFADQASFPKDGELEGVGQVLDLGEALREDVAPLESLVVLGALVAHAEAVEDLVASGQLPRELELATQDDVDIGGWLALLVAGLPSRVPGRTHLVDDAEERLPRHVLEAGNVVQKLDLGLVLLLQLLLRLVGEGVAAFVAGLAQRLAPHEHLLREVAFLAQVGPQQRVLRVAL